MSGGNGPGGAGDAEPPARPLLRIIRGNATAEELAALLAVASAAAGRRARPRPHTQRGPICAWKHRADTLRQPLPHSPTAWHTAGWPRVPTR